MIYCIYFLKFLQFGETHNIRPGWLTIGMNIPETSFNLDEYNNWFKGDHGYPVITNYKGYIQFQNNI